MRVLIPVDGSRNAEQAVRHAVKEYLKNHELEIHLLNVQPPFSRDISAFVRKRDRDDYHREQAALALAGARRILEQCGVPHHRHIAVGNRAVLITGFAKRLQCHHIVIGTARKNSLTRMLQDSVTNKVLELTRVPVEIVTGGEISKLERYGVPAAIATAIGLLLLAMD
ncbi:MAG: universal stress protein [Sulfurifustaceae bacterium]